MNKEKEIWLKIKPHHHTHLAEIRSDQYNELFEKKSVIQDSDEVKKAKKKIKDEGETIDNILNLIQCLNSQLRYNDSIFYLEKALKTFPENYRLERALAIRYLTANKIEKALFLFKKIYEKTDDKLDITYRIGLAYFYLKQYNFAKEYFLISLNLSEKNKEMYIACIYWLLLTNVQLKESINETLNNYHDFFVTHHAGYEYAVRLFLNEPLSDYKEISKSDNLTRVMFLFGLYHFYLYKNDTKKAEETFSLGLKCDEYWASFSGLGFYYLLISNNFLS